MNRSLIKSAAYLQLLVALFMATGCATTQPFFANESPDLQHYLGTATKVEYPDVQTASLAETTEALPPLTLSNHNYGEYWDLELEECVSIALQNAKFFFTTSGTAEIRQNVASQFTSGTSDQFGSIYDIAIQQSTTQSIPLQVDGNGNRVLPRGVLRANQIGGVEDALAEFDAQTSSFIDTRTTDRPRNTGRGIGAGAPLSNPFNQGLDTTQQSAISKRFATGGVATLRQQTIYSRNNQPLGTFISPNRQVASDWTALIEAQIQHPLMRNRGTMINRIPVVLASLNEDIAITEFEVQVRNLVRDVEVAYWDLYVAYRNVATTMVGRNSSQATAHVAQLLLEKGFSTKQDLAQATEQYFQFKGQLESALAGSNLPGVDRNGVYGAERILREKMGLSPTDGRLIRPVTEPTLARVEFDWDESVAQALYLHPELRRTKTRIKQNELELIAAKNQILPEVNLSLLYRWVGVGDEYGLGQDRPDARFPNPGSSALAELTRGDYQEAAVRLDIQPTSIGARRELARIRNAQMRLAREHAFLEAQELGHVSLLSDATAKVVTHYQLIVTNAQRWQAAEQEVQARLAEYQGGRVPVNVVLQSQLRRAQAQIDYYRSLAEYNKSINYVHYLKGTMLHQNSIEISEGPWQSKAYWDALERARERSAGRKWQYGVSRPGVVRQGDIADPETAATMGKGGNASFGGGVGTTLPPNPEMWESDTLLNGPLDIYESLGEPLDREPVEVNDVPLSRLEPPFEILQVRPQGGTAQKAMPARSATPSAGQASPAITSPVSRSSFTSGQDAEMGPAANGRQTVGSGIRNASITDAHVSDQAGFAPAPVRKKPAWVAQ
jgi:outer membrane protein TolC